MTAIPRERMILDAAEKLFSERSFDGVGIDAIGRAAGIVGSGVYRHFASKQEIFATLMDEATDTILVHIAEPCDDPFEDLEMLVRTHVRFCLDRSTLATIWQREHHVLTEEHHRRFVRRRRQYIDRWVDCLGACYPGHEREELVTAIRAAHALISSDTTRREGARQADSLERLLTALTLGALESLRIGPTDVDGP